MQREYRNLSSVIGPLVVVEGVEGAKYDETVEVILASGESRF